MATSQIAPGTELRRYRVSLRSNLLRFAAIVAALRITVAAVASDITTLSGKTYKEVHVTGVDPDGIRITHSYGVTKVPFTQLPEPLRKRYVAQQRALPATTPTFTVTPLKANSPVPTRSPAAVATQPQATPLPYTSRPISSSLPQPTAYPTVSRTKPTPTERTAPVTPLFYVVAGILALVFILKRSAHKRNTRSSERDESMSKRTASNPAPIAPTTVSAERPLAEQPSVGGIGISISFGTTTTPPPDRARSAAKLRWLGPDQPLEHSGVHIPSAMTYVTERSLPWPSEPSAIVTGLRVGAAAADPLGDFGYYPAYERITPEQRRSYLEWLAAGRMDENPCNRSLGYVFTFFYGLERRILIDRDRDERLLHEIVRLLDHYGSAHRSRSLRSYFVQLLHFAGWQLGPEKYRQLWPRFLEFDGDRPNEDGLRFVLANLYQRGEALDWTIAYRLALSSPESRRSNVVTRTQEKFFELFSKRFENQFAGAFVPEAAKQQSLVQYRPASNALIQMRYERAIAELLELRLPNVTGMHRQFRPFSAIWNSCVDDLSGYSRALVSVRSGAGAALARWQTLPAELRNLEEHPAKPAFDTLLNNSPQEGDYTFVPTAALAAVVDIPERPKLTAAQSQQLVELVNNLGWQLAPDPALTGLALAWNQELALFRATAPEPRPPNLPGMVRLLYLAVTVAAADGAIEQEELATFYDLISSEATSDIHLILLHATEASLRRDANIAVRSLPHIAKLIPAETGDFVLRTMARIAAADGEITLEEIKLLRRIARAFALSVDAIETLLREDESFREVTIAGADQSGGRGEKIPTRPPERTTAFALDENRISALTQETREVISLLSAVMADPDELPCAPGQPEKVGGQPASAEWLSDLDPRYHAAVLSLITRDAITTADFNCLAADNHLMPDDLFDAVNTWSDEVLGDFLLDRGENITIFRGLLPDAAAVQAAA